MPRKKKKKNEVELNLPLVKKEIMKKQAKVEAKSKILSINTQVKYKTISELLDQSQPSSVYYTLLILSVFIITCGLLLESAPIVIGGMLVTPFLTPILAIALMITVAELGGLRRPLILLVKSTILTIGISAIITVFFGVQDLNQVFVNDLRTAMLFFIIAATSGVAATFAWVRKEVSDILPGVSIAVSLVPPLSLIGINLGTLQFEAARFYLTIYFLNLIGIIIGSLVIFSLLKFQKNVTEIKKKIKEVDDVENYRLAKENAKKTIKEFEKVKQNVAAAIELEKEEKKRIDKKK